MRLKTELKELDFEHRKQINFKNLDELIRNMTTHIGSTDPELRDNLIYSSFGKLIMGDYLNSDQLEYILETCLDGNHLFLRIGKKEDDSVFTRSFSSLVIALILEKDRQTEFMPKGVVKNAIESSMTYLQKEKDARGYVEGKGWAHSIAHGADLLAASARHPLFDLALTDQCLHAVGACLRSGKVYTDDEDERLIFVIEALLEKGIDEAVIEEWLSHECGNLTENLRESGFTNLFFRYKTTLSQFMKSLYFRLLFKEAGYDIRKKIEAMLGKWHKDVYHDAT